MIDDPCEHCGFGSLLASGRCDHCNLFAAEPETTIDYVIREFVARAKGYEIMAYMPSDFARGYGVAWRHAVRELRAINRKIM
jgi:hypothetical protein